MASPGTNQRNEQDEDETLDDLPASSAAFRRDNEAAYREGLQDATRNLSWVHPTAGYLNAESYFSHNHPFGQIPYRNDASFTQSRLRHQLRSAPHSSSFPRMGIGPVSRSVYIPPYVERPLYMCQPQIPVPSSRSQYQPSQNQVRMEFNPYRAPFILQPHSRDSIVRQEDVEPIQASLPKEVGGEESKTSTSGTSGSNEGSSESESVENDQVGTTPIFHPLPSMFNPQPRPLSFPVNSQNRELPTLALFQNCSLESKVVSDYADSHQELSLMLQLPGLSAHQAPLLSLQQTGDILRTINNPLLVMKVGRLTRKLLPNPSLLKPTDDVGTLALWLSPTSDVRLFWHSFLKGPTNENARIVEEQISQLRTQGEGSPYKELFSHVELSEELAWVAAESDTVDGGSGIRLEMMDHDPSGRSFKLIRKKSHDRQKIELASKLASEEEREGEAQSEETKKLRQLLATCMSEDSEEEDSYFFWIAESSVSEGMQMLRSMQDRLDNLPTLSGESGVPEKKLQELYEWFSKGQKAASSDSALSNEIASWIDLRSGASVPSQLFSNTCPVNVPNYTESLPSTSEYPQSSESSRPPTENTIREGCALSATANFLVADKKWGLTHLATASVMVAVGVESTGLFYDEAKAHVDLSHHAHELAKKRAEAGASAEAERLGRIRLEELVAVKSLNELRTKAENRQLTTASSHRQESHHVGSQSEELINHYQSRAKHQTPTSDYNGQRRPPMQPYISWSARSMVPGQNVQGNSVWHQSHVQANPDVVTPHMNDYFRQHVHYVVPMDHQYPSWRHESGEIAQLMPAYQQYDHPSWNAHGAFHPPPWPYGGSAPPQAHQSGYGPPHQCPRPPPVPLPTFFPRHLPPQLPFLQVAQIHNKRNTGPNMSLVRIAQEAREKVARSRREWVRRAGPSGSNLAAPNVDLSRNHDNMTFTWNDPAHELGAQYQTSTLNVARIPDGDPVNETRSHATTQKHTATKDTDKI